MSPLARGYLIPDLLCIVEFCAMRFVGYFVICGWFCPVESFFGGEGRETFTGLWLRTLLDLKGCGTPIRSTIWHMGCGNDWTLRSFYESIECINGRCAPPLPLIIKSTISSMILETEEQSHPSLIRVYQLRSLPRQHHSLYMANCLKSIPLVNSLAFKIMQPTYESGL